MDSYWDLYVAYVHHCVEWNKKHDIDPHHYEMEWNHFLPQCIFGDQPIGHHLLLKQHAIASALQTLAFNRNCMFGWHKYYLPPLLLEQAWPIYRIGRQKWGLQCREKGTGIFTEENLKKRGVLNQQIKGFKVEAVSPEGFVTEYPSMRSAAESLGTSLCTVINSISKQRPVVKGAATGFYFIKQQPL